IPPHKQIKVIKNRRKLPPSILKKMTTYKRNPLTYKIITILTTLELAIRIYSILKTFKNGNSKDFWVNVLSFMEKSHSPSIKFILLGSKKKGKRI
ncbi:9066_t:CDS:2, partial [Gigaspora margarita]